MASSQGQGGPEYCKCKKMSTPTSLVLLFEYTEAKCGKGLFLIYKLTVLPQILLLLHANQHVTCPDPQGDQRHYHHLWMSTVHSLPSLQSRHLRQKIYWHEHSFILTWHIIVLVLYHQLCHLSCNVTVQEFQPKTALKKRYRNIFLALISCFLHVPGIIGVFLQTGFPKRNIIINMTLMTQFSLPSRSRLINK